MKFEDSIKNAEFIIFNSGWSKKWNTPAYFDHFPVLSQESAKWLTQFKVKGVGFDAISVDHIKSQTVPVHITLLSKEILIIENLTNLVALKSNPFIFQCLPIKCDKIDGSPIRAIAFVD
jgi:kynurenine formamidase